MPNRRLFYVLLAFALVLCAGFAHADDRNLLPKYGSLPKTEWQKAADDKFLAAIDEEYHGDRKKASEYFSTRGWQYLQEGDPDVAMRRFNQAWLLNNDNGIALWGMAAVEASKGQFDESLKLFAEAEKFVGENTNFSVDYAKAVGLAAVTLKDDRLLEDAFSRFERIYKKASENTLNLENWAITLYGKGRYSEAWEKVRLAEATPNGKELDPHFLEALKAHMPQPQN